MKNKKSLFAIVGLTAVLVGGTTLAYFTQSTSVENNFATKDYSSTVTEEFTPDKDWQPGTTTTKKVGVTNTGDYEVLARASWTETWTKKEQSTPFKTVTSADGEPNESVVAKSISANWLKDTDGYYYYNELLMPNQKSGAFLTDVTLNKDTDMGTYLTTYNYTLIDETKIELNEKMDPSSEDYKNIKMLEVVQTLDPNNSGYANAEYKLTITIDVIQANEDAVLNTWNTIDAQKSMVLGLIPAKK